MTEPSVSPHFEQQAFVEAVWNPARLALSLPQQELFPLFKEWVLNQRSHLPALVLSGRASRVWKRTAMRLFERAIVVQFQPLPKAAEALRILGKVVHQAGKITGQPFLSPRIPNVVPHRRSPFCGDVVDALARLRQWKKLLDRSLREQPGDRLLEPLLLSAVLQGGLWHPASLVALVRALATPSASIDCLHGRVSVDLSLSWRGEADSEKRRWFPDDVTAGLLLRLPSQVIQDLLRPEEGAPDGTPLSDTMIQKRLWKLLRARFRSAREPGSQSPKSLAKFIQTVALAASTALPFVVVAYATRQTISHSLKPNVWKRLAGAPPPPSAPASVVLPSHRPVKPERVEPSWKQQVEDLTDLEPDWLHDLRRAFSLPVPEAQRTLADLLRRPEDRNAAGYRMTEFGDFLLREGSAAGHHLALSTVRRYTIQVSKQLGCLLDGEDPVGLSGETLENLYAEVLDQADRTASLQQSARRSLRAFHYFLMTAHQREPLENHVLGLGRGLVSVDANVLTLEEYEAVLDWIGRSLAREDLKQVAQLLVAFGFRCGLRRMEALKLMLHDVLLYESPELLIRPSEWRRLKTKNATRKIPLGPLLDERELEWLTAWTRRRKTEGRSGSEAVPYLFAIPQGNGELLIPSPEMVFNLIHPALREVTGDPTVRFHHLRHSFGSWTFLRLLLSDRQSVPDPLPYLPKTTVWLRQSKPFREQLYGHSFPTRKHAYAVASLLGHAGPEISFEHYIHCLDLVTAETLRHSPRFAPKSRNVILACGPSQATAYRWARHGDGAASLPAQLYARRFPEAARQIETAFCSRVARTDSQSDKAESGFRWIESIYHFLHRAKTPGLPLYRLMEDYSLELSAAERLLARARYLCTLRVGRGAGGYRHRMAEWIPDRRKPDHKERFACPERPHLRSDRQIVKQLAPRVAALWKKDPALVHRVLDYYVHHAWQTRNALLFKDPDDPEPARDYLRFLKEIGVKRDNLQLVSFDLVQRSRWRERWRIALGLGTRDRIQPRRAPNKENSGAVRWLGIEPVWSGADENSTRRNDTGSYGYRFTMVMAAIAFAPIDGLSDSVCKASPGVASGV